MRVIVTRPLAEAERWVQGLAQQGIEALAVPLIEIRPLAQTGAIAAAWRRCRQCQAIMFVSAAAVAHFFAARPPDADLGTPEQGPRLWAPGPGTVAALVRQGVDPRRIDAPAVGSGQYDSEALWAQVGARVQPHRQVMLVRGAARDVSLPAPNASTQRDPSPAAGDAQGEGRDWLARQLVQAGAQLQWVVTYWRAAPRPQAVRQALAQHGVGDDDLWLFTSSQAIGNLRACMPGHDWSRARAIASHARIVAAAREAGFGEVQESRPALADVAASIKSAQ